MPALAEARPKAKVTAESRQSAFTPEEAANLFDATARQYMGMSGVDFLSAWDNDQFRDPDIKTRAMRVAILIPLIRKTSARTKSR
jgi:hypothetical protein